MLFFSLHIDFETWRQKNSSMYTTQKRNMTAKFHERYLFKKTPPDQSCTEVSVDGNGFHITARTQQKDLVLVRWIQIGPVCEQEENVNLSCCGEIYHSRWYSSTFGHEGTFSFSHSGFDGASEKGLFQLILKTDKEHFSSSNFMISWLHMKC